ncbi:MAG: B12-binding domain-containing radical SAM protein, partial [Planctomycetes bacterium]|nr:B12-binding domain-containing radical SAM protein [Planctomycetota bacterium]
MLDDAALARLLDRVEKPARYIGGELHQVRKEPAAVKARICLAFPDAYEIGMSHLGLRILYAL